ncbi:isoflavone reductase family protein [Rhizodiscina lignyota]|uniref:Isoflavone reductase family protein n=1 Tax=Rhizodiscina lignyota TaxID=1504668 RepID=A0A9P4IJG7_9PEZI|nr:isoflavone reductase family protein [Rhizodiscina lignyota]
MRIAIAGTNSLAVLIAYYIQQETNYHFVLLSRSERPTLEARDFPVLVVDYDDTSTLQHALLGVDVVISTVTGNPQVALIHAAAANRVSRFAPAEFGSTPNTSSEPENDPLDRGRSLAVALLEHYKTTQGMEYTLFICGILYERFAPGGLYQQALSLTTPAAGEGDYILNVRNMTAEAPIWDDDEDLVSLCLTSAQDVARFVVEALEMRQWPTTLSMVGERMSVQSLVALVEEVRGTQMQSYISHNMASLQSEYVLAASMEDSARQMRAVNHIATAMGRFDFREPALNRRFRNIQPVRLRDWLIRTWGSST